MILAALLGEVVGGNLRFIYSSNEVFLIKQRKEIILGRCRTKLSKSRDLIFVVSEEYVPRP